MKDEGLQNPLCVMGNGLCEPVVNIPTSLARLSLGVFLAFSKLVADQSFLGALGELCGEAFLFLGVLSVLRGSALNTIGVYLRLSAANTTGYGL